MTIATLATLATIVTISTAATTTNGPYLLNRFSCLFFFVRFQDVSIRRQTSSQAADAHICVLAYGKFCRRL